MKCFRFPFATTILVIAAAFELTFLAFPARSEGTPGQALPSMTGQPSQPQTEITEDGCAIQRFAVFSPSMNREIQAEVVLPPEYAQKPDKRYPVLFAMHGMSASFCRQDVNLSPEKLDEFANQLKLAPLLGSPANNPAAYHAMDLFTGIRAALEKKTVLPPIYLHCGTEDDLLAENRAMHGLLKSKGISFEYLETQGSHDWKFWKEACVGILEFHWKHFAQGLPMESNCR